MSDTGSPEQKKLYRSRRDRKLAGVCGGMGEYFGVDANLIRLGFIVVALFSMVFLVTVIYFAAAMILDDDPDQ